MHQPIEASEEQKTAQPVDDTATGADDKGAGGESAGGSEVRGAAGQKATGKGKRGRPRVLSEGDLETICGLVTVGCSRRSAARYVGCSPGTIINQMQRDEKFADQLRKAEVRRMVGPLQNLREQSNRSWRAAAWFLERADREHFGRQIVEVAPWQEVEKLFRSWTEFSLESIADPKVREHMKARAQELIAGVKRCHRKY